VANLALVFDILAKDGASGPFKNVGDAAENAGKQTSAFGASMSSAMKLAGGALLGAGIVEGFKALYNAADESRKITNLTAQVIKSTGGAAKVSAKQVGDLAGAIAKKTGVDDEAIQSGQNLLLTFTNVKNVVGSGNDIFNQATKIMTDMSVALGQDASGSAIQLGKALNDPIKGVTALQRVGVSFTASQKEQIATLVESGDVLGAQKLILAELGKEFGGAAEAAATPLGKLQQRLGDLAEQVGGYLIPMVDKAATFFNDKLLPGLSDAGSVIGAIVIPAFKGITTVIGAAADAFNALPGPLQAAVVGLVAFKALGGPISGVLETVASRRCT
jgi:phage-related minor tail protein